MRFNASDIAPILFNNCVSCHRPGEVAPFSLLDYKSARKHAKEIGDQTATRSMPPWKPEPGFGDFIGVRRLNDAQISLIHEWVRQGKREGNPSDLPAAPQFPGGWRLGEPDMVVKMPKAYTLRADGPDDYRCFVIPLNLKEDTYVTAVDFHASNPRVVHHALFFLDTTGKGRELPGRTSNRRGRRVLRGRRTRLPAHRRAGRVGAGRHRPLSPRRRRTNRPRRL